ncbi:hypothetical protein GN958_ATG20481 [Phytophthora infestans]|uniref:Uncharacterized protein n=1 Tax=Phytophthora infestans TaxID=4787 RepID=A0A8S9TTQ4_PHYIN|nr:hypothetical protein GN958_ATG20481 [Phytophthora infestans]
MHTSLASELALVDWNRHDTGYSKDSEHSRDYPSGGTFLSDRDRSEVKHLTENYRGVLALRNTDRTLYYATPKLRAEIQGTFNNDQFQFVATQICRHVTRRHNTLNGRIVIKRVASCEAIRSSTFTHAKSLDVIKRTRQIPRFVSSGKRHRVRTAL